MTTLARTTAVLAALLLAAALTAVAAAPAAAAGNGRWAVVPTPPKNPGPVARQYFFLESPPGQTVLDSVRVTNLTDAALTLRVYGADAYNTAADGGFGLREPTQPQHGIGAWTSTGVTDLVVPARRQADIPFTVAVPANAGPGDHVGGIVVAEAAPSGQLGSGGTAVAVRQAVAARLYLRVSGPATPGLTVGAAAADRHEISYTVTNSGNLHLAPTITVTSSGLFGHAVTAGAVPRLDLVPGAQTSLRTALRGAWLVDVVSTTVTVTADGGVRATTATTTVTGVWQLLAAAALLIAAATVLVRRRRRARQHRPRSLS
ncbi:hypothetical protein Cs7R123_53750 [Catellatospora sp. TT07R-123]|uniref:WxL protein peptidoglycan domain-containing protein n=1 Tax=Catellatospora sp. TT07R-123 TaxID=2733863 RepID=UPI001B2EF032|nr:DUF916 domain-containing protein [Catellatospora sp. TT07R-123]GHJ48033.1 hypothetical protein Cs7R123_53750 [Catellatospora sp. TT07R-123]